jgi:hypothetical protein
MTRSIGVAIYLREFCTVQLRVKPRGMVSKFVGWEFTMNRTLVIGSLIAALAITSVTSAATTCSIHPAKDATDAQLAKLAKISQADAEKKALARVKPPAKVVGSELQVEESCLVWTLIVAQTGRSGVQTLNLDAGTGKVLSAKHESGK